jgi:hypothetical protein
MDTALITSVLATLLQHLGLQQSDIKVYAEDDVTSRGYHLG